MHNTLSEYAVSTLNIMKVLDKIWGFVKLKLLILRVRGMIRPHKIPRDCIEGMSLGRDNWFRLGVAYQRGFWYNKGESIVKGGFFSPSC